MKELKFRIFATSSDYPKGKMYYPGDAPLMLSLFGDPVHAPKGTRIEECCYMRVGWNDVVVEQYTGLKDKNGKEIYEGEVRLLGFVKYLVEWSEHYGRVMVKQINGNTYGRTQLEVSSMTKSTLLGNIHEHPELLETK